MNPIQNKSSSTTFYWTESNCIFHLNALNSFSIGLLKEKRDVLKNSAKCATKNIQSKWNKTNSITINEEKKKQMKIKEIFIEFLCLDV